MIKAYVIYALAVIGGVIIMAQLEDPGKELFNYVASIDYSLVLQTWLK